MALKTTDMRPADTSAAASATWRVKLLRAVCIKTARQEPGAELDVPAGLAVQLIAANQAVRVTPPAEPAEPKPPAPAVKTAQAKENAK